MNIDYSNFLNNFKKLTSSASRILISSHMNPDNDSVSSCLAMKYILEKYYKIDGSKINIIYSDKFENRWDFLVGSDDIKSASDITEIVGQYDLVIFVDAREYLRFTKEPEKLKLLIKDKNVVVIDHHEFNPNFEVLTDFKVTDTSNISCSDLIYEIFLSDKDELALDIAEIIMSGILSDSGNFIFISKDKVKSFKNIEELIKKSDVSIQNLSQKIDSVSYPEYKYLARYIENSSIIEIKGKKYLYSYIDEKENNAQNSQDMNRAAIIWIQTFEGKIKGISTAIVAKYRLENNGISVSLRSKKNGINVCDFMQKMELGGGHPKASGGIFKFEQYPNITPSIAIDKIFEFIQNNDITINEL